MRILKRVLVIVIDAKKLSSGNVRCMTTTSYQEIAVDITGPVGTVTFARPDALNAITPLMLEELNNAFSGLVEDASVTVAILTGEGRAFSAGVDLKALGDRELVGGCVGDILDLPARRLTDLLSGSRLVTIAKVNGFCFTGALELALACDLMVVADEATLADTHAKFGLRPTWGMSQRLPALVGMAKARELSYTARNFKGIEAAAIGMAAKSVPLSELDSAVAEIAASIAGNSVESLLAYKDLYAVAESTGLADGLAYEAANSYDINDTDERLADFRK